MTGTNVPDSSRFTAMAAGSEDRNPDTRERPVAPDSCRKVR